MKTWPDARASDQLSGKEDSWLGVISTSLSPLKPHVSLHRMTGAEVCQSKETWRHLVGRWALWLFHGGWGEEVKPWQWGISSIFAYCHLGPLPKAGRSLELHVPTYLWWDIIDMQSQSCTPHHPFLCQVQCPLCNATGWVGYKAFHPECKAAPPAGVSLVLTTDFRCLSHLFCSPGHLHIEKYMAMPWTCRSHPGMSQRPGRLLSTQRSLLWDSCVRGVEPMRKKEQAKAATTLCSHVLTEVSKSE